MATDFPTQGDDKKISLRNSEYPQFDYNYALDLRENHSDIWSKGGNIRGNSAFTNWGKARDGQETEAVLDWIKEREAWAARHYENFRLAGVVAQIKWGVIGSRGEGYMKQLVNEEKSKSRNIYQRILAAIKRELGLISRRIKDVDSWDGSASRWPDTPSYCDACLINLNTGPREDWTQSNCKLPVREPGDSQDTFVRQAVYAAAARFNQTEAPDNALAAAREQLIDAYEEMDEEPPESLTRAISAHALHDKLMQKIFEFDTQIEGSDHYLVDLYLDDENVYALYVDRGKLYRYELMVQDNEVQLGERVEVMEVHQPVQTRTTIKREANGRYRWFSVSGTAVLNRSGEIDSRELFDSFVAHAQATGEYPIRQFYHQGESFRTGQADFLARDGYCYITSGLYDDTPLAQAEIRARQNDPDYWGDSIGFMPDEFELSEISNGIKIPVYRRGVNREISTLPEREAAHLFTKTEVRMALTGNAWDAFVKLWDDDEDKARQWLSENPEARNRAIDESGLITRDKKLEAVMAFFEVDETKARQFLNEFSDDEIEVKPEAEPESAEIEETEESEGEIVIDELAIEAITQAVLGSEPIQQLEARAKEIYELTREFANLKQRLANLESKKEQQERQIQLDTPAKFNGQTRVVYRPRNEKQIEGEERVSYADKAKNNMPGGLY